MNVSLFFDLAGGAAHALDSLAFTSGLACGRSPLLASAFSPTWIVLRTHYTDVGGGRESSLAALRFRPFHATYELVSMCDA